MQALLDFFPVIFFGIFYFLYGIYAATAAAMVTSLLQVFIHWLRFKKFDKMQTITCVLIVVLGAATLLMHKTIFIKWKPSVIYWLFAIALLVSHMMSPQPLLQKMLHEKIKLQSLIWKRLNMIWASFFTIMGFLNLYVAYSYTTKTWVYFKVIGTLGLTIVFIFAQALYLAKHIDQDDKKKLAKS